MLSFGESAGVIETPKSLGRALEAEAGCVHAKYVRAGIPMPPVQLKTNDSDYDHGRVIRSDYDIPERFRGSREENASNEKSIA